MRMVERSHGSQFRTVDTLFLFNASGLGTPPKYLFPYHRSPRWPGSFWGQ